MPAPTAETEPLRLSGVELPDGGYDGSGGTGAYDTTCGYQWTNDAACAGGSEHVCSRIRTDHRSHLCTCQAVELRTATHLRRARPDNAGQPAVDLLATTVDIPYRRR